MAALHNTEFRHGSPLVIAIPSCKLLYKSFMLSGAVYGNLQLGISVNKALVIYIAKLFKLPSQYKTCPPPPLSCSWFDPDVNKSCCSSQGGRAQHDFSLIFQWKWTRHDSKLALLTQWRRLRVILYRTVHLGISFFEGGLLAGEE